MEKLGKSKSTRGSNRATLCPRFWPLCVWTPCSAASKETAKDGGVEKQQPWPSDMQMTHAPIQEQGSRKTWCWWRPTVTRLAWDLTWTSHMSSIYDQMGRAIIFPSNRIQKTFTVSDTAPYEVDRRQIPWVKPDKATRYLSRMFGPWGGMTVPNLKQQIKDWACSFAAEAVPGTGNMERYNPAKNKSEDTP